MPGCWNWASAWAKATRSVWWQGAALPHYLNLSRAEADRIIRLLDEFGPSYFELSQSIRISAQTLRAIAPAVSEGVLHHEGEAIPINGDNSRRVAAAVAEIRSALRRKIR
jgi:hypothetical protein